MILQEFLSAKDAAYDPELCLVGENLSHPGYHTTLENGVWAHPTREALEYAIGLLRDGSPDRATRACDIVRKILSLQDCDPVSPTYGIWSWFAEEPLSQMNPPDWNWADFQGLQLAEIIKDHAAQVAGLREGIRAALYHAGGSIYRRNIHAGYTNISVMGSVVTALVGEILEEKRLLEYGRRRLQRCLDHFEHHGGFSEYNSPVYTTVVLRDCEKGLRLISDEDCQDKIRRLLAATWQTIADHFHPATHQWAGPHSRSYSTFLAPMIANVLASRMGVNIPTHPSEAKGHLPTVTLDDLPGPGCPADLVERFRQLPRPAPFEIRRRFIRGESDEQSTWGTTWFAEDACLGSVNADAHWDQRRGLLAYWVGSAGSPVALRLRFLRDGREFASVFVRNAQAGPRVLSTAELLLNRGVFHPIWGAPKDNIFDAEDLRLRFELKGDGIDAVSHGDGRFELRSGDWTACLTGGPCIFDGQPIPWQVERGESFVAVDAVCHQGARRQFPFAALGPVILCAALKLVDLRREAASFEAIEIQHEEGAGRVRQRFGGLELVTLDRAAVLP